MILVKCDWEHFASNFEVLTALCVGTNKQKYERAAFSPILSPLTSVGAQTAPPTFQIAPPTSFHICAIK